MPETGSGTLAEGEMKEFPRLTTARLTLRAFDSTDVDDVVRLAGDFAIADTTLVIPHPYDRAAAEKWLATHRPRFDEGQELILAVTASGAGTLVGAIGLSIDSRFDRAEIGYWIGKPYWGQGYCTEAGRAMRDWGFSELGLNRIYATHFKRNPASGRVMQNLGMKREGELRQHVKRWDRYEDMVVCGILRDEWVACRAKLV